MPTTALPEKPCTAYVRKLAVDRRAPEYADVEAFAAFLCDEERTTPLPAELAAVAANTGTTPADVAAALRRA